MESGARITAVRGWVFVLVSVVGCRPVVEPAAGSDETTAGNSSAGPASTDATGTGASATSEPTTSAADSTTGDADTSSEGAPFVPSPDGGTDECDVWEEDCPRGMKCMPWIADGGNVFDAYRCSPIAPDPAQVGEPCTADDGGASGIDDCALHSICLFLDGAGMGECVGFCTGSSANPTCPEGGTCNITGGGIVALCLFNCDPLLQDCADGDACYPVDDRFECEPDDSGDGGAIGDPCVTSDACDPGSVCAPAGAVPSCTDDCCAAFCDVSDPEASEWCAAGAPGTACVPWYAPGQSPPGYEWVGVCLAS